MTRKRLRVVARFGGFKSPRSRFMAGSVGLHLAFLAAILFFPTFGSAKKLPVDFAPVELVPGLPGSRSATVRPAAPQEPASEPSTTEPEEGVRVETKLPEPKPQPKKVEKPKKAKKKTRQPPPKEEPPANLPPVHPPAPGEAASAPGGGSDVTSLDVQDVEFAWYRDRVSAALKSHWRQPILEGLRESLAVSLYFEVLKDGSVLNPRIESSSGVPSLDRSALRAVIEADPLPPLPSNWRESKMTARFVFRWYP